jgi:hypothetical protein
VRSRGAALLFGNVRAENAEVRQQLRRHVGKAQRTAEPLFQVADELDETERIDDTSRQEVKIVWYRLRAETDDGQRLQQ